MTEQEKTWFDEIAQHRQRAWDDVFSDSAFIGVMRGVVEKYTAPGHFVYELLQNADDAHAKDAKFELYSDRLVFRHNGKERFTVTSRASEKDEHTIKGHLNALTSIGASEKIRQNDLGNVIGKFGVGFKAVFQYTNRPEIYDDNMSFALENYIVPKLLDKDYLGRKVGETVFVFPFDRGDKPNAQDQIWQALQTLVFPTLFLNHLKCVGYCFGDQSGEYRVDCSFHVENVGRLGMTIQKLSVVAQTPTDKRITPLWLFSSERAGLRCSVGYVINDAGEIVPADYFAFCFFPTRHQTKLKFIIHAPFLLNDSREGILSGTPHNEEMVKRLSDLAVAGLEYLCSRHGEFGERIITDDIVKIIPISQEDYGDGISFDPFRVQFLDLFQKATVLPTKNGYVDRTHAYWPESIAVPGLFSDEQLQALFDEKDIRWAFPTIPRENKSRNVGKELTTDVFEFIEKCTSTCVYDNNIISRITAAFIESQPMDWINKLYDWIAGNEQRVHKARTAPIFYNQHGRACAVCAANDTVQLYLPLEGEDRYDMVRADLLENEHARKLLDKYNLKEPDRHVWIQMILTQKLPNVSVTEVDGLLKQVLGYYMSCGEEERAEIISQLKEIVCWKSTDGDDSVYRAGDLYSESEALHSYFDRIGGTKYLDAKRYQGMVDVCYARDLQTLFRQMGVAELPRIERREIPRHETQDFYFRNHDRLRLERSTGGMTFVEGEIDGLDRYLQLIESEPALEKKKRDSLFIWKMLGDIAVAKARENGEADVAACFQRSMSGVYSYFHRKRQTQSFPSEQYEKLRFLEWLVSADGRMVSAKDVSGNALDAEYSKLPNFSVVCAMLEILGETQSEQAARAALSDVAKDALALGEQANKLGLTAEDLEEAARIKDTKKLKLPGNAPVSPSDSLEKQSQPVGNEGVLERTIEVVERTVEKTRAYNEKEQKRHGNAPSMTKPMLTAVDSDPMQPRVDDFEKQAEDLRKKMKTQMDQLNEESKLRNTAMDSEKYSYAWLMACLELEMRASGADDEKHREASVSFLKMEREPDTENLFMLSVASEAIPQWFEEEVNQRLTIRIPGRQDIETVIESMSVQSFRLRAKVRILPGMENIDYSQVVEAKTVATKPSFLLNALKEGYENLHLDADYNLKAHLPEQMRFIFGPPGTGKTTHLARKELIPLAKSGAHPHVLVLTPTNKAADVLTRRIIQECGEDESYKQWLTRFGITLDPALQGSPVARAKDVVIDNAHSAVVITTVIRFAYDAFTSMGGKKLADFKWDYIVVDEASMIPLMQILYPIYKAHEARFVISGDPMQIAPVVTSDLSEGKNIYTMVGLEDFANPRTEPHAYEVVRLNEQFRSVPCIGRIFSKFAYSGLLQHHRSAAEEKDLDIAIDGMPTIRPLTLLRFPVSRFESIFKCKHLGSSSYQIYSALFVFEFICKLAEGLRRAGRTGFRIGVISPYRAQADIVGRLVAKVDRTMLDDIEVNVGTVHSFQGDECEMIIALLNPPQGMGYRPRSFINDRKVLNVAISRARDYLVVAIPDAKTPNVQYLRGPLAIAELMQQSPGVFAEMQTPDLETSVWGDPYYVEKNTFSTGHQNVNVYETPEKRFEVRSEDTALDVHFRADRSHVAPDETFVSERSRIENEVTAEEQARANFVVPEGFHKPTEGERVPAMKQYYVIGVSNPLECESEAEDIDPIQVLAIED